MSHDIHPTALVAPGAELGPNVVIGPYCVVSSGARLGEGVRLASHVVIEGRVEIGPGTTVGTFSALGGAPQIANLPDAPTTLIIGAGNVIREHVSMHRGSSRGGGVTRVGDGGLFMAQTHVGHDCLLGDRVILAQGAVVGGHSELGDGVYLGGLTAVHQFCRLGAGAFIGGVSAVLRDVPPFALASGNPAVLLGPNLRGLMRRGAPRARIHALRKAFSAVFAGEDGTLDERIQRFLAAGGHADETAVLAAFLEGVKAARRPLITQAD